MTRKCSAKNSNSEPCGAFPINGSKYCFSHDPKISEKRRRAQVRGGRNRKTARKHASFPGKISHFEDILKWINITLEETWIQENSAQRSRTLGYLLNIGSKIITNIDLDNRLETVESAILRLMDYADEQETIPN